ncbi:helix-turn-helix transcriptional regulator [Streptomyces sp. NPDC058739]|uniref:helix-turn-helix transcriptional regulator n=1 Tax=Streptomyces sp. NPDC058739 TaxID=3346618 RepID=UPI00367994A2
MDEINAAAAARRLGVSEPAVRKMISAGRLPNRARTGPALVAAADVDRVMHERRADAQRRHPDAVRFAEEVWRALWPSEAIEYVTLEDGRRALANPDVARHLSGLDQGHKALGLLTPDAAAVFGRAAVETAAMGRKAFAGACRFCFADVSARVHGGLRPTDAPAYRVLLGEPCPLDRQRWAAETEARRKAADGQRLAERARQRQAAQSRAKAELESARSAASAAASRLQTATRAYAPFDPAIARQAASQVRQRGAFSHQPPRSKWPSGCDCDADRQCAAHADSDRRAVPHPRSLEARRARGQR